LANTFGHLSLMPAEMSRVQITPSGFLPQQFRIRSSAVNGFMHLV